MLAFQAKITKKILGKLLFEKHEVLQRLTNIVRKEAKRLLFLLLVSLLVYFAISAHQTMFLLIKLQKFVVSVLIYNAECSSSLYTTSVLNLSPSCIKKLCMTKIDAALSQCHHIIASVINNKFLIRMMLQILLRSRQTA